MTTNNDLSRQQGDILRVLGRLEEGQAHASEGRKVIHEKLDRMDERVGDIADTVLKQAHDLTLITETAKQARDEVLKLRTEVDRDVKPQLASVGTFRADAEPVIVSIKKLRLGLTILVWLLGAGGVLTGGTFVLANAYAKAVIREWLEIDVRQVGIVPNVE